MTLLRWLPIIYNGEWDEWFWGKQQLVLILNIFLEWFILEVGIKYWLITLGRCMTIYLIIPDLWCIGKRKLTDKASCHEYCLGQDSRTEPVPGHKANDILSAEDRRLGRGLSFSRFHEMLRMFISNMLLLGRLNTDCIECGTLTSSFYLVFLHPKQ